MAITKVKGIVVGGVNVKEKDRLVTIYSLEKGKILCSMKGVRGEKAKFKFAKELFCFADFILEDGKANLIVTGVDIIDNFYGLSQDIDKYYEACAIVDIVCKNGNEPNPVLFIEIIKALRCICYENCKKYYVFNKFLLNFLKSNGWGFLSKRCSSCGATLGSKYFNLDIGEVVCPSCKNNQAIKIADDCWGVLNILDKTDYEKLSTLNISSGEIQACSLLIKDYEARTGNKVLEIK